MRPANGTLRTEQAELEWMPSHWVMAEIGAAAIAVMFLAYAGLVWRSWSRDKKVAETRFTISNMVETGGSHA